MAMAVYSLVDNYSIGNPDLKISLFVLFSGKFDISWYFVKTKTHVKRKDQNLQDGVIFNQWNSPK